MRTWTGPRPQCNLRHAGIRCHRPPGHQGMHIGDGRGGQRYSFVPVTREEMEAR